MANLSVHPAPGLSNILPGWYVVPQNPMALQAYGVTRTPGIGDIVAGCYPVPQNPVVRGLGGCNCGTVNGMAGFSEDWTGVAAKFGTGDIMGGLQAPLMGIPVWGWAAGAVALMVLPSMMGGGRRRR